MIQKIMQSRDDSSYGYREVTINERPGRLYYHDIHEGTALGLTANATTSVAAIIAKKTMDATIRTIPR